MMLIDPEVRQIIAALGLVAHPEGGMYRETFRTPLVVEAGSERRVASTAIYYLLTPGALSALHRVRSADEVWHLYDGGPVELHTIDGNGTHHVMRLGRDLGAGERPQAVVRAGIWQAAVCDAARFALCGCTVAPGFDFADFEMARRADLVAAWPHLAEVVVSLTRS
jgi:predicted cupin superfamily sugar epimerase